METNVYYDRVDFQCLDQIEHQTNDLYLTRCGIHQPSPGYVWGPKKRPQYHMHFILEGSGYFEINHQIHHLKQGQIFLIPLIQYHATTQTPRIPGPMPSSVSKGINRHSTYNRPALGIAHISATVLKIRRYMYLSSGKC